MAFSIDTCSQEYKERFLKYYNELKWLYCELYENRMDTFERLCSIMYQYYQERKPSLKKLDQMRSENPDWYKGNHLLGMTMYADAFGGNLEGVRKHLNYIEACNVNFLHLLPLLDSPEENNDGGYAVSDFCKVKPRLGNIKELEQLAEDCHQRGISLCLDFIMNHTSEEHKWAKKAKQGQQEFQDYYYFYDNYDIPSEFEKTIPQVFPVTAAGNFTWLPDIKKFVMTTFYPYQWDLNYQNPIVLNEMIRNLLNLVNLGIDVIRMDALPYIWKQLGTSCRNLPQVHNIVRILRIICEIVCPSVLLLGEVVMTPDKVIPYFGTAEKPECHMLYNVTAMATTWNCVATKDIRILKQQMDVTNSLPKEYVFLNYLRCHDDIGWNLDYSWLEQFGIKEVSHKAYLNHFFIGQYPASFARGELYNADPASGDARLCGTTASLCGIEKARYECRDDALESAINLDIMLHACMLVQSGIPIIYSGDEIGQENDYSYHRDLKKKEDSRYLHRGKFSWKLAGKRTEKGSIPAKLFYGIEKLERIRKNYSVFGTDADVWTIETWDNSVLGLIRAKNHEKLIALFNFSEENRVAWIKEEGEYTDLISGKKLVAKDVKIAGYGMCWLLKDN